MSVAPVSSFEQHTATIPGTENITPEGPENSLQRIGDYPVVKDTISYGLSIVQSNSYSAAAYKHAEAISQNVLAKLAPLQDRLPIETVDGYANSTLDFVEKRFPAVKDTGAGAIVDRVRKPADDARAVAKSYADGISSRISPVTDQLYARVTQGQESLHALQERLSSAIASIPRDKASASEAIASIQKEVESISNYVSTHAKELPAHVEAAVKPLVEGVSDALQHIKVELSKTDVPITQRGTNVLAYTREKVTPLLASLKDTLVTKRVETQKATENATAKVTASS